MRFFNPRWRKVFRDLGGNKSRTLLVVLSMAVGIFAIGVVSGSQSVLLRDLNGSYAATQPESGIVIVNDNFDDDLVAAVDSLREVDAAQGKRAFTVRFKLHLEDEWRNIELKMLADYKAVKINIMLPQAGRWPPDDREVVLERTSLAWMGANVGDIMTVQLSNGKERTMKIVGTVHDQSSPPAAIAGQGAGYVARDTLPWLNENRNFNRLEFTVANDKLNQKHIEAVGDLIRQKIENSGLEVLFVAVGTPGEHPINSILQPMLLLLNGLGGLSLVLSGFLVVNTISALLTQQTRQIGIMKSIGAQRGQIVALYFATVLLYGAMSLIIAIPLGAVGALAFTQMMAYFFNFDLSSFTIPANVIATQVTIGLVVPLMAAFYPIMTGTRITVREAISEYGLGHGRFGRSVIDRVLQRIRGMSRPLMISLRNTFRRKTRLALTLVTLTLAGAIFITIFSVRDSLLLTMNDALKYWNYHIAIRFEREYRLEAVERVARQLPEVSAVESWGFKSVRRVRPDGNESDNLLMIAPRADTTMLQPTLLSGRWLQMDDENKVVVNTDLLKDETDLKLGDEIIIKIGRHETKWQIVGIVQGILAGPFLYANYPYFARVARDVGEVGGIQITTNQPDAAGQIAVAKQLETIFKDAGYNVTQIQTVADLRAQIEVMFNFLVSFLLVMAVVLAIVGGLGLMGTMSINVLERVREIGVMRAIGASDGAILRMVMVEGMLIGLISWFVAVCIAFPLSKILSDQVGIQLFQSPLSFAFSFTGVTIWFLLAVTLAAIASFLPARGASRLTVREVLAYE